MADPDRRGDIGAVVIGTGPAAITHIRALQAAGVGIRALVGRDPSRTARRASHFGIPHALTSLDAALALDGVDAVTIATPPNTHAPLVLAAVQAGMHVVCEKPLARDADEAAVLLEAATAAGVVHLLGTEFRFAPAQILARRTVAAGAIGTPRLAIFLLHVPFLAGAGATVPGWWAAEDEGGGLLGAHAPHVLDQVRTTLGEFEAVSAVLLRVTDRGWSAEDSYSVMFRLVSGVTGVLQATVGDAGPPLAVGRIIGSAGTLCVDGDAVSVWDSSGVRQVDVPDDLLAAPAGPHPPELLETAYERMHASGTGVVPYARLFDALQLLVAGDELPHDVEPATFADGLANMRVLDALRRSAREGSWVLVAPPAAAKPA